MPHINNMSMCAFLTGFNDSFAHIRGQVLLVEPLPLINKVFPLILQEEQQSGVILSSNTKVENVLGFSNQQ